MPQPLPTFAVFSFVVNVAFASLAVSILAMIVKRLVRKSSPMIQHDVQALMCVSILLIPFAHISLRGRDFGLMAVQWPSGDGAAHLVTWSIFILWAIGTSVLLVRFLLGFLGLAAFRRTLKPTEDRRLQRLATEASRAVGLEFSVEIATTRQNLGPFVAGLRRPWIVVPQEICEMLSNGQLLCILVHEFEHIRRRDVLSSALQQITDCLYWWNPCYFFALRDMESIRERACDDRVTSLFEGQRRRDYLTGLALVAEWSVGEKLTKRSSHARRLMLGLLTRPHDLVARIQRLNARQEADSRNNRTAIPMLAAFMLFAIVGSVPFIGQARSLGTAERHAPSDVVGDSQRVVKSQLMYLRLDAPRTTTGQDIASLISRHRSKTNRRVIVDLRVSRFNTSSRIRTQTGWAVASSAPVGRLDEKATLHPTTQLAPMVALLVDAESTSTLDLQAVLADSDLPAVIISPEPTPNTVLLKDTSIDSVVFPYTAEGIALGQTEDVQLQRAICVLSHV